MATPEENRRDSTAGELSLTVPSTATDGLRKRAEIIHQKYPIIEETIQKIQRKTGIENRCILFALAALPVVFVVAPVVINLVAVVYPLFMSVKSIEKGREDRTRWLVYWLLYNSLVIFEFVFGLVLILVPGFGLIKCLYLIWCMAPIESNGCLLSYRALQPLINQYIFMADEYMAEVNTKMEQVFEENKEFLAEVNTKMEQVFEENKDCIREAVMAEASIKMEQVFEENKDCIREAVMAEASIKMEQVVKENENCLQEAVMADEHIAWAEVSNKVGHVFEEDENCVREAEIKAAAEIKASAAAAALSAITTSVATVVSNTDEAKEATDE